MATIALGTIGGMAGGAIGGPIGAIAGRALGALAGSWLDQQIVSALTPPVRREGPRLATQDVQGSSETTVIGRHYGRARMTGNLFWATRYLEEITEEASGGKGSNPEPRTITTTYQYFANFAVGICEGPVAGFGRIWADGEEIEPGSYTIRRYLGDETQVADPLIEAKEGIAPAYRGLAYLVFERLPVAAWGNRIPQIAVEAFRPTGTLEPMVRGVAVIAGNEFGFDTVRVQQTGSGGGVAENRHTLLAGTDFLASLDRLQLLAPNLGSVMLVVPWFGTDLRCAACEIKPMVDTAAKTTAPYEWAVSGLTRGTATLVSQIEGRASAGGTPSDASVIRAIAELNARGLDVTLCPFVMMDIAAGNTLPDPYSDEAVTIGQPAYPWRGRITISPETGFEGSPDQSAEVGTQVDAFMGTAAPGDFAASGTSIDYSGPAEWRYRRFILHYARLAEQAGGVEAFLIGSEMVRLSRARSSATDYPFVAALRALATDVAGMLPGAKLGYAADWSEWNTHRPDDGTGDVLFHLDPLWSDPAIDFIGIDNYLPLSDWRDGHTHLDFLDSGPAGPNTIYDPAYLGGNVRGGEYFDWTYASPADRAAQIRTPIADSDPADEPWMFRQKDLLNWWQNAHHDRPGGVRSGAPTDWVPGSKPIRFTELGCSAVDKGANQPNVFPDPKSSEGAYPHFSNRARDDAMQRAWLEAMLGHFEDPSNNPGMVDLNHSNLWCWDARPWPDFPLNESWGDHQNWHSGHWLSGRLGSAPAAGTIAAILDDAGFARHAIEPIPAVVDGVTVGGIVSARSLLEALRPAYQFDAVESDGVIRMLARLGRVPVATIQADDLVITDPNSPRNWRETRAQETELPDAIKLGFGDPARDDQSALVEARRGTGGSLRLLEQRPPVILSEDRARAIAELELHSAWHGRERTAFTLPPSYAALDAGDVVTFLPTDRTLRIDAIGDGLARTIEAWQYDPAMSAPVPLPRSAGRRPPATVLLDPELLLIDGAMLRDGDSETAGYIAGVMAPFRSGMAAWRSPTSAGYVLDSILAVPATIGESTAEFFSGPTGRWDRVNELFLDLRRGALASAAEELVLNGANTLALENADGEWEYLQFATATPNGERSYVLTNLLRGQRGTENAMRAPVAAGARLVLINGAVRPTGLAAEHLGLALNWKAGAASEDIGSPDLISFTHTHLGRGRRPLAPAHLRGIRDAGSGDWVVSLTRRTRLGGDSWDQEEVPLGESAEAYRLQILDGPAGAVLRQEDVGTPAYAYPAAQQAADFGTPVYSFWARVAQISPSFGPGIFLEQQVWVR
jgi:hypothetical protein